GAAVAVRDHGRAERDRRVDRRAEAVHVRRRRLDEEDLALRADRRRHLDVERDLAGPALVGGRQRARLPRLVHLLEAAVGRRARRQAVLRAVDAEVLLGVRVVHRVDDRDGQARALRLIDLVGGDEIGRPEAARRGVRLDQTLLRRAHAGVAGHTARRRRRRADPPAGIVGDAQHGRDRAVVAGIRRRVIRGIFLVDTCAGADREGRQHGDGPVPESVEHDRLLYGRSWTWASIRAYMWLKSRGFHPFNHSGTLSTHG